MTTEGYIVMIPVAFVVIITWLIVTRHDVHTAPTREEKSGMLIIICMGALLWPLALIFLLAGFVMRFSNRTTDTHRQD